MALALDPLIHQPVRLRIMTVLHALGPEQEVEFTTLRDMLGVTNGNLGSHLRKLEEAGYVRTHKTFVLRRPRTYIAVTGLGLNAYQTYLMALERLLRPPEPRPTAP